jgi:CIC family chloride channel protein
MAEHDAAEALGDFTATPRLIWLSLLAVVIGIVSAVVAKALLALIALSTNLFYLQRWSIAAVRPADHHLGVFSVLVPVAGALIIGLMARYGSERIRGHGIPEAIEAILINGSRVEPKVAVLKPLSSAISIGSGGPFGAEGPIIMTGGAVGSVIAQFFHLTSAERKTLLVSGAAAGMAATFASPIAAVLLAVELLLFEWKPRSMIPVALASATAAAARRSLLGLGPLFPVAPHPAFIGPEGLAGCVLAGLLAGLLSATLTAAVYAAEDGFARLPVHWMWWPALGGLVVGVGGLIVPEALGVGYETIGSLVQGEVAARMVIALLVVKAVIWSISLGSGTSGGELTHDVNMLLPLLVAVSIAHGFTVLTLKRSILTEKIARRGYHLSREYAIDPLEILFAREVMRVNIAAIPSNAPMERLIETLHADPPDGPQRLYPVVGPEGWLEGVVTRADLRRLASRSAGDGAHDLGAVVHKDPAIAYPDEPLRVIVHRMAETGLTRFPVVERGPQRRIMGMISLEDLLKARTVNLEAERRRERTRWVRIAFPFGLGLPRSTGER